MALEHTQGEANETQDDYRSPRPRRGAGGDHGIGIAVARSADIKANVQAGFYAPSDNGSFADETVGQWYCGGRGIQGGYLTPQLAALLKVTPRNCRRG